MKFIADLHIHSHFSRATSRDLDPEHLAIWAKKKGISVIGTGDVTHPGWISELQGKLVEAENGLFQLKPEMERMIEREVPKSCQIPTRFLLSGEISCIYKRGERTRKLHHLILMPDMGSAIRLNEKLDRIGNISSDGRPILGLDSRDLLEIVLEASDRAFFIPAHIWTPWFSLFGSKSGFDSLEECFGDLTSHIHALETGLSSDPPMNRLLSALDDYLLVSNSDAHSPSKLGREANVFDTQLDYDHILQALEQGNGFVGTIEFFPEEGKYHFDGHRKCQIRFHPKETRASDGICPSCGKPLTVGVLHRVEELADRDDPIRLKDFYSLIPLTEILSELLSCGPSTKKVMTMYEDLLVTLGPELQILMDLPHRDIEVQGGLLLAKAIDRMRQNQVIRQEGYDGEYGVIRLFDEREKDELVGQKALFQLPKKTERKRPVRWVERSETHAEVDSDLKRGQTHRKTRQTEALAEQELLDPILDPLNPAQREAVLHDGSHLLIVAGPGTGKTMTLAHRIAFLIRSELASPNQILALTFTNKAAREMRERIAALIDERSPGGVWVSTFHGFCLEILRNDGDKLNLPSPFTVCSEWDASTLAHQVVSESGTQKRAASGFLKILPQLKMLSVMGRITDSPSGEFLPLFQKYQESLRNLGMLDLDDLETESLRLFRDHPGVCKAYGLKFPWIFVDEYQDTNPIQVELLKALVHGNSSYITAIGDPDQAIYGFRGADVRNFHRFIEDFPGTKKIELSRNYRSSRFILKTSSLLIGRDKPLEGTMEGGDPLYLTSCGTYSEEAEMIVEQIEKMIGGTSYFSLDSGRVLSHEEAENFGFGDIAVLFRLNAQGDAFQEAFARAGIPFIRSGEKPLISRFPVNIIWRFFQALQYPDTHYYLKTYLDLLEKEKVKGKGALSQCEVGGSLPELIDQAVTLHQFHGSAEDSAEALRRVKKIAENFDLDMESFLDVLSLERGIDHVGLLGDRVALMSLHAAKGLEWPVVFITGCEDGLIPCSLFGDRNDSEEKRLLYVGMTRARLKLILSHANRRVINGRALQMKPSPFLSLIPEELCQPLERAKWKRKSKTHKQLDLFQA